MSTYYFSQGAEDDNWANPNNWYFDSNSTIPANSVPSSADDAIILGFLAYDSSSSATINNLFISGGNTTGLSITVLGLCTIDGGYFGDGAFIIGDVLLTTGGYLLASSGGTVGTVIGDLTFENNGQGENGANNTDVYGNVYFLGNWIGPYAGSINIYNDYGGGNAIFYYGYTGSASPTFYGTGISYYANYPTLYFNGAVDSDWNTVGNWWVDSNFSNRSYNIPTSIDDVVISASVSSNSGSEPNVVNLTHGAAGDFGIDITVTGLATFNSGGLCGGDITGDCVFETGTSICSSGSVDGDVTFNGFSYNNGTITGDCTFNNSSYNSGTITGYCTFNSTSSNGGGSLSGTITGDCTFNDSSYNNGTITGACTFNSTSENYDYGTITGACTFNGYSENDGTIYGDCTFNDDTRNREIIYGDCTFNSTSANRAIGATITGDCTFNDSSANNGTVAGDATFNDNSYNDGGMLSGTIYGDCTFNDSSYNGGTITGNATFNDNSYLSCGGIITGNVTFNDYAVMDSSLCNAEVIGNATFNDNSYAYGGLVTGNATFNDNSYSSYGTVTGNATFNDNSYNTGALTCGSAVFNDNSVNTTGSVISEGSISPLVVVFNNNSINSAGTIQGNATFNHNSVNFDGDVTGNATFNDASYTTVDSTIGTFLSPTRTPYPLRLGINNSNILGMI
jgi:hypothetical protein